MGDKESKHILAAILILTIVSSFYFAIQGEVIQIIEAFVFSTLIILVSVLAKELSASSLDAQVSHSIWQVKRYGFPEHWKLKSPVPAGLIFPIFFSLITIGIFKFSAILTYEASALKRRAAKRFGTRSFTHLTEFHNALIGASSILALLVLAIIVYAFQVPEIFYLAKLSVYYALANLVPISKLDGTQIYFGSRILYSVIALVTLLMTAAALLL
jgi:Zn-dependent protease